MTAASTIPTAISAAATMTGIVDPLLEVPAKQPVPLQNFSFWSDRAARARCTNGCRQGDWRLPSVGGYAAGSESCLKGPGGPMVFAVNTESGIQDIRSLLVFLWPAGHSFADRIVVLAACRRNDAPSLGASRARVVTPSGSPTRKLGIGAG